METLTISGNSKQEKYASLLPQVQAVMDSSVDIIANMANMAAMLHETFGFWWTGFYRVIGDELMLGPFQGPLACKRIAYGRGVCGTAWKERHTLVVPVFQDGEIIAVLDIDSDRLATFDDIDAEFLERIVTLLS